MTLLTFVGQIGCGLALDALIDGRFSVVKAIGGGLILVGLVLSLRIDAARGRNMPPAVRGS